MARCEYLGRCPFFSSQVNELHGQISTFMHSARERFEPTGGATRLEFCLFNSGCCARYTVAKALGVDGVPPDLRPNEVMRVRKLIEQGEASGAAAQ